MQLLEKEIKKLFSEEVLQTRIQELAKEINKTYKNEEISLICVLKGSVMFMTDLAKYLTMPVRMEFIRLSSYGTAFSSSGKVNPVDINLPDLNGKNVLIIEDIIDTGITAKFLIDLINDRFNTKTTRFCSLLDKKSKRENDMQPDFAGFEIENLFVVGYGLDYEGYYRNIPYIGYVET
ncbi:hypoxanthine phosphoribosyltransferase [bacterium]|nr:hypoxanthine phosphoribosyltransferase [bacterium]